MKRFLDCNASDFEKMTKEELLAAIAASEGAASADGYVVRSIRRIR